MCEQLADAQVAHPRIRQVFLDRVGEIESARVAQAHHQDGGKRLGNRADAVLRVAVWAVAVDHASGSEPDRLTVADDRADQARCATVALRGGDAVQQGSTRRWQQFLGHVGQPIQLCVGRKRVAVIGLR